MVSPGVLTNCRERLERELRRLKRLWFGGTKGLPQALERENSFGGLSARIKLVPFTVDLDSELCGNAFAGALAAEFV